jgi:cytochrome c peroxidase
MRVALASVLVAGLFVSAAHGGDGLITPIPQPSHAAEGALARRAIELTAQIKEKSRIAALDALTPAELVASGEDIFFNETFGGNGRTCGTCHRTEDSFGLKPSTIAALPGTDPLFVAEFDANLTNLERPPMMRSFRGGILENIDGFANAPVFRNSPHFLNLALTAPYGLSGEFADLQTFATGAVMQHFPKTLNRQVGVDFRLPTAEELAAMEAFMKSVFLPLDQNFALERFVTTTAQRRGSDLFFGQAKCFNCHNGPVLAEATAALGGGNRNFNTGVVNQLINLENRPENPGGGAFPSEAHGLREFNTPPLIGIRRTVPFFHDHSAATLQDAVAFYDSGAFNASPAAALVGGIQLTAGQIDDLTAFLESLDELSFSVSPSVAGFGAQDLNAGPTAPVTVTITSAAPLTVNSVALGGGPQDDQFAVSVLNPTTVEVTFDPTSKGPKKAVLEINTDAGNVGVPLRGVGFVSGSPSFNDVLAADGIFPFVETLFTHGITAGCGGGDFCPDGLLTRTQLAVMLATAMGLFEVPPRGRFADVPPTAGGAGFIERLAEENVTAGCGGGNYCPNQLVTRAQAAVLIAAASGKSPVNPQTGVFADVPPGSFGAGFIERLAADGIAAGCGGGNFCPGAPITRAATAVFIAKAFGL